MSVPNEPAKARIVVELVRGADPISGTIRDPDGSESIFSGWLELLGALERIRGPQPPLWGEAERGPRSEEG